MRAIIDYLLTNWQLVAAVLVSVLEAILRLKPTQHNWSILSNTLKALRWLLNLVLPNKKKVAEGNVDAQFPE